MNRRPEYRIRPFTEPDLAALGSGPDTGAAFWTADQLRAELAQPHSWHFAAVQPDPLLVLGYICGRLVLDEAEIFHLATGVVWRRQGVASALLDHVMTRLPALGATSCFLEVRESNSGARHLYERFGFSQTARRKNYYSTPSEDAIIMVVFLGRRVP